PEDRRNEGRIGAAGTWLARSSGPLGAGISRHNLIATKCRIKCGTKSRHNMSNLQVQVFNLRVRATFTRPWHVRTPHTRVWKSRLTSRQECLLYRGANTFTHYPICSPFCFSKILSMVMSRRVL